MIQIDKQNTHLHPSQKEKKQSLPLLFIQQSLLILSFLLRAIIICQFSSSIISSNLQKIPSKLFHVARYFAFLVFATYYIKKPKHSFNSIISFNISSTFAICFEREKPESAVMAAPRLLFATLVLSCLVWSISGKVLFSTLQRSLVVTASPKTGTVLKGGEDKITVTWILDQTLPAGTDSAYKTIKVKFCYAPISQVDRAWRKTVDIMAKDKTCQFTIVAKPYNPNNKTVQSFETTVEKFVPTATYFVRAYAHNSDDIVMGYGQTTDALKKDNLFKVEAVSGRHLSMDIASVVFSGFSVVALFGFFINEKRKGKRAEQK